MVVLSSPFFELQFLKNYSDTVGLWFTNFEFNSSFYSIGKPLMSMLFKIRLMEYMPFIVPIFVVFVVLYFMRRKTIDTKTIAQSFFWILTLYFLVSTTVHPWYLATLVFLSCFTRYKFALVWSATVFLSYFGYQQNGVDDNTFWKLIEYFSVGMYLLFEGLKNQKTKASSSS